MICQYCNNEYIAKRATSKYCSDACRKLAFRNDSVAVSVPKISVAPKKEVSVANSVATVKEVAKFVNHITGVEHDITEVSKRTGLNYNLNERSERLGLKKYRCKGCGEPTWFGCAECGKK